MSESLCVDAEIVLQLSVESHEVRVEIGFADIHAARAPPVVRIPFAVLHGPRRSIITPLLARIPPEGPYVSLRQPMADKEQRPRLQRMPDHARQRGGDTARE